MATLDSTALKKLANALQLLVNTYVSNPDLRLLHARSYSGMSFEQYIHPLIYTLDQAPLNPFEARMIKRVLLAYFNGTPSQFISEILKRAGLDQQAFARAAEAIQPNKIGFADFPNDFDQLPKQIRTRNLSVEGNDSFAVPPKPLEFYQELVSKSDNNARKRKGFRFGSWRRQKRQSAHLWGSSASSGEESDGQSVSGSSAQEYTETDSVSSAEAGQSGAGQKEPNFAEAGTTDLLDEVAFKEIVGKGFEHQFQAFEESRKQDIVPRELAVYLGYKSDGRYTLNGQPFGLRMAAEAAGYENAADSVVRDFVAQGISEPNARRLLLLTQADQLLGLPNLSESDSSEIGGLVNVINLSQSMIDAAVKVAIKTTQNGLSVEQTLPVDFSTLGLPVNFLLSTRFDIAIDSNTGKYVVRNFTFSSDNPNQYNNLVRLIKANPGELEIRHSGFLARSSQVSQSAGVGSSLSLSSSGSRRSSFSSTASMMAQQPPAPVAQSSAPANNQPDENAAVSPRVASENKNPVFDIIDHYKNLKLGCMKNGRGEGNRQAIKGHLCDLANQIELARNNRGEVKLEDAIEAFNQFTNRHRVGKLDPYTGTRTRVARIGRRNRDVLRYLTKDDILGLASEYRALRDLFFEKAERNAASQQLRKGYLSSRQISKLTSEIQKVDADLANNEKRRARESIDEVVRSFCGEYSNALSVGLDLTKPENEAEQIKKDLHRAGLDCQAGQEPYLFIGDEAVVVKREVSSDEEYSSIVENALTSKLVEKGLSRDKVLHVFALLTQTKLRSFTPVSPDNQFSNAVACLKGLTSAPENGMRIRLDILGPDSVRVTQFFTNQVDEPERTFSGRLSFHLRFGEVRDYVVSDLKMIADPVDLERIATVLRVETPKEMEKRLMAKYDFASENEPLSPSVLPQSQQRLSPRGQARGFGLLANDPPEEPRPSGSSAKR